MADVLLEDLLDWLRIPSISTGGGRPEDLERAAAWVVERVVAAGGDARVVPTSGHPLAVGELRAADPDAPTVIAYGHYDVQAPGPPEAWTSPPFEPEIRDGRIYARGAADDKGNVLPLLHVACALARDGALPVHVRVLVEGEEEAGSASVTEWVRADDRGADCAIVFDSGMVDERTPAITLGLRGMVMAGLEVRTAARDLHSGIYGGTALNALHALHAMLAAVLPGPDGRLREELRAGVAPASEAERASWARLPSGEDVLAAAGGRAAYPGGGGDYSAPTGPHASLDVNAVAGGEPRTMVPAVARATLSQRLAPGQEPEAIAGALERLLRAALPEGADLTVADLHLATPALFAPDEPAISLAAAALERACGVAPALVRSGGSIPVVAELAARGLPVVVTGFATEDDAFHAPDESFRVEGLRQGEAAARELLTAMASLRR
jgi:acetylornithine deacetylase/succinyl-diaminopimelate desuccinylase-like protein